MNCVNCQNRIEQKLRAAPGVLEAQVSYAQSEARVRYDSARISLDEITAAVESLDYTALPKEAGGGKSAFEITGTLVIIAALYMLLRGLGIGALASAFPLAAEGMNYGMILVIGLVTSLHCAAMCGGINLSQCLGGGEGGEAPPRARRVLLPAALYNGGRLLSYTAIGALAGTVGQAVSVSGRFQGALQLAAGVFMMLMGVNMLNLFPGLRRLSARLPRLPRLFGKKIAAQKTRRARPFMVGLLNGLMPCGPLQAMELYALSTGNPAAGAFSMLLFGVGTAPLLFGIGAVSSALSGAGRGRAFRQKVLKAGAILVTVMGMMMFGYGMNLFDFSFALPRGVSARFSGAADGAANMPVIEDGVQIVNSTLSPSRYPAITVRRGIPVRWTINAPAGSINGCNNRMIIREYGIEHRWTPGDNVIEFVPERAGRFSYSCWMGMIRSSITVLEEGESAAADTNSDPYKPLPAGVTIEAAKSATAKEEDGFQTLRTVLKDDGIEPALLIVRRGVPVVWTIANDSLEPGNAELLFPAFYTRLDMAPGDNFIRFIPSDDFDFSTADHVFYGYVKVVDDVDALDHAALRAEIAAYETLIYPDAYFDDAAAASGCCR
jgi:sulfite exporter TauE/SafE/copper chaperone CopZ